MHDAHLSIGVLQNSAYLVAKNPWKIAVQCARAWTDAIMKQSLFALWMPKPNGEGSNSTFISSCQSLSKLTFSASVAILGSSLAMFPFQNSFCCQLVPLFVSTNKKIIQNTSAHLFLSFPGKVTTLISDSFEHWTSKAIPQHRVNQGGPLKEFITMMPGEKTIIFAQIV